jgi:hypothetical protein
MGVHATRQWIYTLRALPRPPRRAVIYLHGASELVMCVYSDPPASALRDLDTRIGERLVMQSAPQFLSWAFPP